MSKPATNGTHKSDATLPFTLRLAARDIEQLQARAHVVSGTVTSVARGPCQRSTVMDHCSGPPMENYFGGDGRDREGRGHRLQLSKEVPPRSAGHSCAALVLLTLPCERRKGSLRSSA